MRDWDINIYRGVLTGYNEAFIIDSNKREELLAACKTEEERQRTTEIIRPILRGRDIKKYSYDWADLWLINTHNGVKDSHPPVNVEDYPTLKNHLNQYWDKISKRDDQGITPYNLRNCAYMDDFNKPKIVYAELARTGNAFTIDNDQLLISNTSYMITFNKNIVCSELYNLLGFLNSKIALFYLDFSCSKFDDNGWRWLRQFVEKIPIPTIKSTELQTEVNNSLKCPTIENIRKINFLVYEIIGLNAKEVDYLEKKYSNY